MVKVEIPFLIGLCNNLDEYNMFNQKFSKFISDTDDYERDKKMLSTLSDLQNLSNGQDLFGKRKIKRFYKENKEVIDKLNKINCEYYNGIASFISVTQIYHKKEYQILYEYITRNKEKIESILAVLNRLQKLGFEEIEFDENANFTQKVYKAEYKKSYHDTIIVFFENMEYIPSYGNFIKYRTTKSSYKIKSYSFCYEPKIVLNNLSFDPSSLPERVDFTYLYNRILAIVNEQEHISYISAIDLGLTLNDIEKELKNVISGVEAISSLVNKLQSLEEKAALRDALLYMNLEIARMKQLGEQYKGEFLSKNPQISEEVLKKEAEDKHPITLPLKFL